MENEKDLNEPVNRSKAPKQTDSGWQRPPSPAPSGVSLKSDKSMPVPLHLTSKPVPPSPAPSGVSLKSDKSMPVPLHLTSKPVVVAADFKHFEDNEYTEMPKISQFMLTKNMSDTKRTQADVKLLRRIIWTHKANLKKRVENVFEGIIKPGAGTLLNKIYTELYITGQSEQMDLEHEVWQVESAFRAQTTEDTPINCNDIFKPLPGQHRSIKTVMTKGVAGIGKTVSVQKFILDWTNEIANQDIDFMFSLPFRELNLISSDQYSLHRLLLDFYPELEELNDGEEFKDCQILFIFDGWDESRLTLNFEETMKLTDVKQTSSIDVLISSLIHGSLLPSAFIWITSRPAAASQIPSQYINQVTEVRGFSDPQKEEYFRKRISDESLANRVIIHIKASRSLHIMCHIPVFCWIAATVLEEMLKQGKNKGIPKTLTEMFIHFLLIQTTRKDQKYHGRIETDKETLLISQREILLKLAELAFKNLKNGNLIFYEEDLRECGLDVSEASVYSGMCTEIFKAESVFHQRRVYCFVHLSIQEFLAAVFVFHSYITQNFLALKSLLRNRAIHFEKYQRSSSPSVLSSIQTALGLTLNDHLHVLLKCAVDEALTSRNGHLDLFLRFLMGISLESNQRLLYGLLDETQKTSCSIKETCHYMKKLNQEGLSPERCINLFHCLFEMNDHAMHKEIQKFLSSKKFKRQLSPAHCSALAHMLLMSDEVLDEFNLKSFNTSDEGRRRLIPALRCYRIALLDDCKLTDTSCGILASILKSQNSLIEVDLSKNDLGDSGACLLSEGLAGPQCKLKTLRLSNCGISDEGYVCLALTLMSNPSCVKELDVRNNHPGESSQKLLSDTVKDPYHRVNELEFVGSNLTDKSCKFVASFLLSPNSLLKLDLSENDLGDSGVQILSKGLSNSNCKLQTLRLSDCLISENGCICLASVLTSNPSHLQELDLSYNHPGELGLKLLSARLKDPRCKLQILKIDHVSRRIIRQRLLRYSCKLTLDSNTAGKRLCLSEEFRKVTHVSKKQLYPDHSKRFDNYYQVLCVEGLCRCCYWEVEWSGTMVVVAVVYKTMNRKKMDDDSWLGGNAKSWSLECSPGRYSARHNKKDTAINPPSTSSNKVGVYLDWQAGTLTFYSVSPDALTHLHTFSSTFTEPLYPGFGVYRDSSVSLCTNA